MTLLATTLGGIGGFLIAYQNSSGEAGFVPPPGT